MLQERKELYSSYVEKVCKDLNLDDKLLKAIVEVESSWNPMAIRYEPAFLYQSRPTYWASLLGITATTESMLQRFSWGLGQIMGATARSLGMKGPIQTLSSPDTGSLWSAVYLKKICQKYDNLNDRIAAYNAGSAAKNENGLYRNQQYVYKVLKALETI